MDITRVTAGDLPELLPLLRGYLGFYDASPPEDAVLSLCRALIADPEREGLQLIARAGVNAIGFATIFWTWSTTRAARIGTLNDLYVAPEARGSGVAEALIEAARQEAGRAGAGWLEWQTAPDNARAQAVYDRIGGSRSEWVTYDLPTA